MPLLLVMAAKSLVYQVAMTRAGLISIMMGGLMSASVGMFIATSKVKNLYSSLRQDHL